jgi:hypothetical protein
LFHEIVLNDFKLVAYAKPGLVKLDPHARNFYFTSISTSHESYNCRLCYGYILQLLFIYTEGYKFHCTETKLKRFSVVFNKELFTSGHLDK